MTANQRLRRLASSSIALVAAQYVQMSWRQHYQQAQPHALPGRLVVTLTSYPPRYPTLALTIESLLAQSIRPDLLHLWIAEADMASLPADVLGLQSAGLVIRPCEDLRSYKKIIPALLSDGESFLVTADDDVFYPRHWLRDIVQAHRPGRKEVICTRAHRIRLDSAGLPLPYQKWESEIAAETASALIFPTGIGGVLYEPGIFHPDVTRIDLFQRLCPTTDDIWLYWMAVSNGARFRKIGRRTRPVTWRNSQQVALASSNAAWGNGNDEQVANLLGHYGFPETAGRGLAIPSPVALRQSGLRGAESRC